MTRIADDYSYIARRTKELEEAKQRARNELPGIPAHPPRHLICRDCSSILPVCFDDVVLCRYCGTANHL